MSGHWSIAVVPRPCLGRSSVPLTPSFHRHPDYNEGSIFHRQSRGGGGVSDRAKDPDGGPHAGSRHKAKVFVPTPSLHFTVAFSIPASLTHKDRLWRKGGLWPNSIIVVVIDFACVVCVKFVCINSPSIAMNQLETGINIMCSYIHLYKLFENSHKFIKHHFICMHLALQDMLHQVWWQQIVFGQDYYYFLQWLLQILIYDACDFMQ